MSEKSQALRLINNLLADIREPDFIWQVDIGELHLVAEDRLGRFPILGDDAAALIAVEQRVIQPHDGN